MHFQQLEWKYKQLAKDGEAITRQEKILDIFDDKLGYKFTRDKVTGWTERIVISEATKEEMNTIKKELALGKLDKHVGEFRTSIQALHNGIMIEFAWDTPDTCEVTFEETIEDAPGNVFIDEDGKAKLRKVKTVVNCGKPITDALFNG